MARAVGAVLDNISISASARLFYREPAYGTLTILFSSLLGATIANSFVVATIFVAETVFC